MAGQATTPAHVSLQAGTAPQAQTMSASLVNGMDPAAAAACDEILAKATDLAIRPFVIGQWSKSNEVRTATIAVENTPESPPVVRAQSCLFFPSLRSIWPRRSLGQQ